MKGKKIKLKIEQKLNSPKDHLFIKHKAYRDHFMYELFYKNRFLGIFQISMGSKEFGPELIGRMARQLGISSRQLKDIVYCKFWACDFLIYSKLVDK